MQCEQIRGYLDGYVKRNLPTYKLAWVAQHLAGCERCRELAGDLAPAPVDIAGEAAPRWESEAVSYGVQRRVPGWVRVGAVALVLLIAGAAAGALRLAGQRASVRQPQPQGLAQEAQRPVSVQAAYQSQLGITLTLESATRTGSTVEAAVWFSGRGLTAPEANSWLRVFDEDRREVDAQVTSVLATPEGIAATVRFDLPPDQEGFLLRFSEVSQTSRKRWLLILPNPLEPEAGPERLRAGRPSAVDLIDYAVEGELLKVHLRFMDWHDQSAYASFDLHDGEGAVYSAVKFKETLGFGDADVVLHYPLPRELRPPFTLVGNIPVRKQIGPWLLDGNVIE